MTSADSLLPCPLPRDLHTLHTRARKRPRVAGDSRDSRPRAWHSHPHCASPHWKRMSTGRLGDGLAVTASNDDTPCYIGEFPPGPVVPGVSRGTSCPFYADMHVWICESLEAIGINPVPVLLSTGGGGFAATPSCKRHRLWWHSHAVPGGVETEAADPRGAFRWSTEEDAWDFLRDWFRRHNPSCCPQRDLPLAWRLTPGLWDSERQRITGQLVACSKLADERLLDRLSEKVERASRARTPLDAATTREIRKLGIVPTGRTVAQVRESREGRVLANAPTELLTVLMNLVPTSAPRDPLCEVLTQRRARSAAVHAWNRWQILVMLRSFRPVPGRPVLVIDLFSGIGTGMLAAVDTPSITAAPHVLWVAVEKSDDSARVHYNTARAKATHGAFSGQLEYYSYRDVVTGGLRRERVRGRSARLLRRQRGAWWESRDAVDALLDDLDAPRRNVLVLCGSPCDDCSGNNRYRTGRDGVRSRLFEHAVATLCAVLPPSIKAGATGTKESVPP